jgi:hypothetical protein
VLEREFDWDDGVIEVGDLSAHRLHGYTSVLLARARRKSAGSARRARPAMG